jgi:hypothetical protein
MKPLFRFEGTHPYLKACHPNYPALGPGHLGRAGALEAVTKAGVALSQATLVDPKHAAAVAAEAQTWRDVLALALEGVEAAIVDVYAALGLPGPQFSDRPPSPAAGGPPPDGASRPPAAPKKRPESGR